MNKKILSRLIFGATLLLLAACSRDEATDPNALPEGQYPLQIASVTMSVESSERPWSASAPQTRVSENADGNSSVWTNGDRIGVQIGDDTETSVYTVNVDASGKVTSLTPTIPLYWKNTTPSQTVTAWYTSPETNGTIDLSNQTEKLSYVLKGTGSGDYNNAVRLTFNHALAKVRVKLEGEKATDVTNVKLYTYISCTHTKGTVSNGPTEDWISMKQVTYNGTKCYEANVVPGYEITKFKINSTEGKLTNSVTSVAGNVHTITITVARTN